MKPFLTVNEAASRMGVDPSTLYRLCQSRKIQHRRIGTGAGRIVFSEADLDAYLAACVVPVDEGRPEVLEVPLDAVRRHFRPQGEAR